MKAIPKSTFSEKCDISQSSLYRYTRVFQEELNRLGSNTHRYNYKAALFLCYKLGVDPAELYPKEDPAVLLRTQEEVMLSLYGNDRSKW